MAEQHVTLAPIFLAFTTSDLSQYHGWPIEIGFAVNQPDGSTKTWSSLIRPADSWDRDKWSPWAQKAHGIEFKDLATAPASATVAADVLRQAMCEGVVFVVGKESKDQRLMNLLLSELTSPPECQVISFDELLQARALTAPRSERVNRYYQRIHETLRAEAAAASLAYAYKQVGDI